MLKRENVKMVQNAAVGHLYAGVAKNDISGHLQGVNDPLYAKALVLDDGITRVAIIAIDTIAIRGRGICDVNDDLVHVLRSQIQRDLSIDWNNILVNASHTHAVEPKNYIDSEQLDKIIEAVGKACENMVEVKVGSGVGFENRIMVNRDLMLKNGKHSTIRQANPCPPDSEVANLGPVDPDIGILRIDRLNGEPLAIVYTFSCHPLLGVPNGSVTANFPGFASKIIEESMGTIALFLQGTGGNVTEVLYKDVTRPMDSGPVGKALGLSTLKALKDINTGDAEISVICEAMELPRRTDILMRIENLRLEQRELLKSLRFTSLNFKSFLPLYIKYAIDPDYPSDYSYRYRHAEQTGSDELQAMDRQNRNRLDKYLSTSTPWRSLPKLRKR